MNKSRLVFLAALLLVLAVLAGCGAAGEKDGKSAAGEGKPGTGESKPAVTAEQTSGGGNHGKVRLAYAGGTCEAPIFAALQKGFFKEEGIEAELIKMDFETLKEGLASGKVDGASANFKWIKAVEQGLNLKLTAGIHTGCIQSVVPANSPIKSFKDLKGRTIGVEAIGGGPMILLSMELQKNGIDPKTEVSWKAYPGPQLEQALARGEIDAFGIWDPFGQMAINKQTYRRIFSSAHDAPYKNLYCCFVGISSDLVEKDPAKAAAITRAWLKAAEWVGQNPKEAAQLELDNKYVGGDLALNTQLLSSYAWKPGIKQTKEDLKTYIKEEKAQKILETTTDEEQLFKRIFAEVIPDYKGN